MDFVLRSIAKTLLNLGYSGDLSILDETVSKINEPLEVLGVQAARIGLKINVKKTTNVTKAIMSQKT